MLCSSFVTSWPAFAQDTREDPAPFGTPVMVGDWSVRVSRVQLNADSIVLAANQFNDPPPDGFQFVMALLDATYLGPKTGDLKWDADFKVVGLSNRAFDQGDPGCGVVPRDIYSVPEAYPGGRITANVCWAVPKSDIRSLVMFSDTLVGQSQGRKFFALSEPGSTRASVDEAEAQPSATRTQIADARAAAGRDTRFGGRHNPIPLGQSKAVGDWTIRVRSVIPDATNLVMAENSFNDSPARQNQFVLVQLDARLSGDVAESTTFWTDLSLKVLGPKSLAFGQSEADCGVIPDDIFSAPEVFPGGIIQGNACWEVRQVEADSLLLIVEPNFGSSLDEPIFFSLS
jgi:hypothetical protein